MNWMCALLAGFALTVSALAAPPQETDSVKIVSISPTTGVALRVGERVTFSVEIEYHLASTDTGRVTLVMQQNESGPPLANEVKVVQKGRGRVTLSKNIKVPATKTIEVFVPLHAEGNTKTRLVDSRSYKVENGGLPVVRVPPLQVDTVKIVSISPDTKTALRVGEKVTFRVDVEYNLISTESGRISLVIQQSGSDRKPLGAGAETEVVLKGKARLALSKEITVPDTTLVQVFVPLYVESGGSTHVVDTRFYKVEKN